MSNAISKDVGGLDSNYGGDPHHQDYGETSDHSGNASRKMAQEQRMQYCRCYNRDILMIEWARECSRIAKSSLNSNALK